MQVNRRDQQRQHLGMFVVKADFFQRFFRAAEQIDGELHQTFGMPAAVLYRFRDLIAQP